MFWMQWKCGLLRVVGGGMVRVGVQARWMGARGGGGVRAGWNSGCLGESRTVSVPALVDTCTLGAFVCAKVGRGGVGATLISRGLSLAFVHVPT